MKERILLQKLLKAGWTQAGLAERFSTTQQSISYWVNGVREPSGPAKTLIRELAAEVDSGKRAGQRIPIMGRVGAGGDVDPDYEQIPAEGIDQVELPYIVGVVGDPIGFEIVGDSNEPKYSAGEIVVVEREPKVGLEAIYGNFAVVLTADNKRFLKRVKAGEKPGTVHLHSAGNTPVIENVRLKWASPVEIVIPHFGLRRIGRPRKKGR